MLCEIKSKNEIIFLNVPFTIVEENEVSVKYKFIGGF